jgi:hypothetical protein
MVTGKKTEDILKNLSTSRPEHSRLVIVLREETASICIFQYSSTDPSVIEHLPISELNRLLDAYTVTGKDYDHVAVFCTGTESTLVPLALASEELHEDYLKKLFSKEISPVHYSQNGQLGLELIYAYPEDWHELLLAAFPQADLHHISELVMLSAASDLQHHGDHVLYAHLEEDNLFIMAFRGKDLVFFNSFSVKGETDILYFILHSMDSLGMDYQNAEVHLSGYNENMDSMVQLLHSYCPQALVPDSDNWKDEISHVLSKHALCAS